MRIKFKAPDPRAGFVAEMDSHRGQEMVDSGAAVRLSDRVEPAVRAPVATPIPPPALDAEKAAAAAALVDQNAADVIAALDTVDRELLQPALDAEKAGKIRKTVIEALEAVLAAGAED